MGDITVKIDKKKCVGCGLCVTMCPDVFEMGEDGKSKIVGDYVKEDTPEVSIGVVGEELRECVEDAKKSCPVDAIVLE